MALNDWTNRFLKNPVKVAWEKSISPPHGYQMVMKPGYGLYYGVGTSSPIEMGDRYAKLFNSKYEKAVEAAKGEYAHAKVEVPTGMMSLEPATGLNNGGLTFNIEQIDGAKLLEEIIKEEGRAQLRREYTWAKRDKIPVYFLPWASKRLLSLSIPEYKEENVIEYERGVEVDPLSPHIFFTAAINGCSVFVNGDPARPTVTHAGISEGSTPYGNEAGDFWRDLLMVHQLQKGSHGDVTYEVNKAHYVNATSKAKMTWTINSARYRRWLSNLPDDMPMALEEVQPFGCVFGVRYGRLWSFYLQENASVKRYKIVKKKVTKKETRQVPVRFLGFRTSKVKDKEFEVEVEEDTKEFSAQAVPMRVAPFYPRGPGKVTFEPRFRKV
jgi:hypothetical protein